MFTDPFWSHRAASDIVIRQAERMDWLYGLLTIVVLGLLIWVLATSVVVP